MFPSPRLDSFSEQAGGLHFQHEQQHFRQLGVGLLSRVNLMQGFGEGNAQILLLLPSTWVVLHQLADGAQHGCLPPRGGPQTTAAGGQQLILRQLAKGSFP